MPTLLTALQDWNTDTFAQTLKAAVEALPAGSLPLHLATTQGGMVDDRDIAVSVLHVMDDTAAIHARIGVFFTEMVGGCNCHDDPVRATAYGLLQVSISKASAEASFALLPD